MIVPINRYLVVEPVSESQSEEQSFVLVPDTAKVQPTHSLMKVVGVAHDCQKFNGEVGSTLVVNTSMVEEVSIGSRTYNIVLENHVIGVFCPDGVTEV